MLNTLFEKLGQLFRRKKPMMYLDYVRGAGQNHDAAGNRTVNAPPGVQPVVIKTETATIPGLQALQFTRKTMVLKDEHNAKFEAFEINRNVLHGCGCVVTSPNDVAYLSDLTGLPVCRRCAATCVCGHKVAPSERVMLQPRIFICKVCHESQVQAERRSRFWRWLLGPFITGT